MNFGKAIIYLEFNTTLMYDRNHSQNCLIELNLLIVKYGMFGNWLVSEYNDFQEFEVFKWYLFSDSNKLGILLGIFITK